MNIYEIHSVNGTPMSARTGVNGNSIISLSFQLIVLPRHNAPMPSNSLNKLNPLFKQTEMEGIVIPGILEQKVDNCAAFGRFGGFGKHSKGYLKSDIGPTGLPHNTNVFAWPHL